MNIKYLIFGVIITFSINSHAFEYFSKLMLSNSCYREVCEQVQQMSNKQEKVTCNLEERFQNNINYINDIYSFLELGSFNTGERKSCLKLSDINTILKRAFDLIPPQHKVFYTVLGQRIDYSFRELTVISAASLNNNFSNWNSAFDRWMQHQYNYNLLNHDSNTSIDYRGTKKNIIRINSGSYNVEYITPNTSDWSCKYEFCKFLKTTWPLTETKITIKRKNVSYVDIRTLIGHELYKTMLHDTVDKGCHNANVVSKEDYNIWACSGSNGYACTYFCHLEVCVSSSPKSLFDNVKQDNWRYDKWEYATGDIRAGCGGAFVYGIRIRYYSKEISFY